MSNVKNVSIDFSNSNIVEVYLACIKDRWNMSLPDTAIEGLYRVMFNSIATMLKYNRTKNNPHIGFKLLNEAGEFCMGAILDYHAPEGEEEDTGNWTLSFTFDEKDMTELNAIYDNFSDMFFTVAAHEIRSTMYGNLTENSAATNMFVAAVEVLINQLDAITNGEGVEEAEITMPGIFKASVGFEDGVKVYSIVPGHNIKQQIKDDKGLSK